MPKKDGELITKGQTRARISTSPLITIITVVYNGKKELEDTLLGIINQTYQNIEYIIVDGGSKDGTLEIVKQYEDHIDYWISEPDKGIYDAMNKGVSLSNGDFVIFMNAGDGFYDLDVLSKASMYIDSDTDVLYGNTLMKYPDQDDRMWKAYNINDLWKTMITSHQSMLFRRSSLLDHPFDLSYRISSDYETILYLYYRGDKFKYLPFTVSYFMNDGISQQYMMTRIYERWRAVRKYNSTFEINLFYIKIILKRLYEKYKGVQS